MFEIPIVSLSLGSSELRSALEAELQTDSVRLELRESLPGRRALEGAVLIAIISGTSAAVSALVTGLLRLVERRRGKGGRIVLRGKDGTAIAVPAGTSKEDIEEFIALARELESPRILVEFD